MSSNNSNPSGVGDKVKGVFETVHGLGDALRAQGMEAIDTTLKTPHKSEEHASLAEQGRREVESGMAKLRGYPPTESTAHGGDQDGQDTSGNNISTAQEAPSTDNDRAPIEREATGNAAQGGESRTHDPRHKPGSKSDNGKFDTGRQGQGKSTDGNDVYAGTGSGYQGGITSGDTGRSDRSTEAGDTPQGQSQEGIRYTGKDRFGQSKDGSNGSDKGPERRTTGDEEQQSGLSRAPDSDANRGEAGSPLPHPSELGAGSP